MKIQTRRYFLFPLILLICANCVNHKVNVKGIVGLFLLEEANTPNYTASVVYGQSDFSSNAANSGGVSANSLNNPDSVIVDSNGNVYISDSSNNRVLYYPSGSTKATKVYGQSSLSENTANSGGISETSLKEPAGMALDSSGGLYVSDSGNSRVLYFPSGSTKATRVYGQPDFNSNTENNGGISASSLKHPVGIALDNQDGLYVCDTSNSRVLYYPVNTTVASRVYGQESDFTTNEIDKGGVSANSLNFPFGVAVDSSQNLYITDGGSRILYFPKDQTTATKVYGQNGSFSTQGVLAVSQNGKFVPVLSQYNFEGPSRIALDTKGGFYTSDDSDNRVLYFPSGSDSAARVFGQPDFYSTTKNNGGVSATSLYYPEGLTVDSIGNLYVADSNNNRVLEYKVNYTLP